MPATGTTLDILHVERRAADHSADIGSRLASYKVPLSFGIITIGDGAVGGVTMRLGVEEPSAVVGRFAFLYNNLVGSGPGIVPHTCDLPTNPLSGNATRDREPVLAKFRSQ